MRFASIEQPNRVGEKGVRTTTIDLTKITHFEVLELDEYPEPVVCIYLGNIQIKTKFTTVEAATDYVVRKTTAPSW